MIITIIKNHKNLKFRKIFPKKETRKCYEPLTCATKWRLGVLAQSQMQEMTEVSTQTLSWSRTPGDLLLENSFTWSLSDFGSCDNWMLRNEFSFSSEPSRASEFFFGVDWFFFLPHGVLWQLAGVVVVVVFFCHVKNLNLDLREWNPVWLAVYRRDRRRPLVGPQSVAIITHTFPKLFNYTS